MPQNILLAAAAGLWFFIPAYIANPSAVLFGGGKPLDGGCTWSDGRRILGDGKTWRGTLGGGFFGWVAGLVLAGIAYFMGIEAFSFGGYRSIIIAPALLSFGSMTGDIMGSFVKRRLGRDRGSKTPVLDQYDFLIGSILFLLVVYRGWFLARYWHNNGWAGLIVILVLTPVLHRVVNIIGYRIGAKDVPW